MIGKHVRYKNKRDKKQYIVVNYSPGDKEKGYSEEICIVQEFPFYPDITKQLFIWQKLDSFDILES